MLLTLLFVIAAAWFIFGYYWYGGMLSRIFELDDRNETPAHKLYDGIDYVPAHPMVLMGHHFASIAGAGPIVGPIVATTIWGWLPSFLWVTLGSVFFGGVHDMGSVVASMRHDGLSMGEVIKRWVGDRAKKLYLIFTWLALVLVIAVFLELAAATLAKNPAVAFAAVTYILLALIFGYMVYRWNISLGVATLIMVPLVFAAVIVGVYVPEIQKLFALNVMTWKYIMIVYIFLAAVLPVWVLLQPRDYLSSWLLYATLIIGGIGMIFGPAILKDVKIDAFRGFVPKEGKYLWPLLFITIACGAISGFHSLVGSGTTSKQIDKETHAQIVGYGGMLLEGIVATIAIGTVILVGGIPKNGNALTVFGEGVGKFAEIIGIPAKLGTAIGLLALNSFILTSLDTATRLARYQFQEFFNQKVDRYTASIIGIAFAAILVFWKTSNGLPMWKAIWPVFGSANQLVAGLTLLGLTVWVMKGLKKNAAPFMYPMIFMMITTIVALVILAWTKLQTAWILSLVAAILVVLALWLAYEAYVAVSKK
jgi:carbon starvation protein